VAPFALAVVLATAPLTETEGVGIRDTSYHPRPLMLSFFGLVAPQQYDLVPSGPCGAGCAYPFGVGGGVRFAVSLFDNGFLSRVNDSFELELGANVLAGINPAYVLITPLVEVRWTFHFSPRFSAYAKVGGGYNLSASPLYPHSLYLSAAVGALVAITRHFYLRAEFGYPGLLLGVGIAF
jgi:hypothetical protein